MKRALNVIISILVLGIVIWWADAKAVLGHLLGAHWGWLAVSGLALTALTFLMARRWQIVANGFAICIPYRHALREYYIAQMVNLVLPGGVAGDVARAVRLRHAGDLLRAGQSVAADRIIGQVVTLAVLGIALVTAQVLPGGIAWPAATGFGCIAMIMGGCVMLALSQHKGATGQFLRRTLGLLRAPRVLVLSLLITALLSISLYACARATGTFIPPSGWFTLIPLILSAMLVPLSVGGWGWREGAAAALFPLIGATSDAGIATGIAYGAMMMIAAAPGLYFVLRAVSVQPASTPTPQNLEIP
jgi:uncharacterized membrane protein YbhN (UPF0104 family)